MSLLNNIPAELRALPQWVVADMSIDKETGKPKKLPLNPRTGQLADVTDPSTWGTFEEALRTGSHHVGFVLSPTDPYTIIDLDNKPHDPATPEQLARHYKILEAFNSYTEISQSGTGYHIVIKGWVPTGTNRDKVEVYSSGRYMICTGNVVRQAPIADYQSLLDTLYAEMQPMNKVELVDYEATMTDAELVEMASSAANGEKFNQLCSGYHEGRYVVGQGQSEADFALLSILAFYTRDNEQVRRIFRMTALGKRAKAQRDTYLNIALEKIRAKEAPPVDISALIQNAQDQFQAPPEPIPQPIPQELPDSIPSEPEMPAQATIELPPGLVGELALYIYQTSLRPVPDIALATALALTAGIVGRSYNISGSGLNQYIILLARTGAGKEGAATGIDNLIAAVRPMLPMLDQFIGPSAFASGQALIKVLDERPCFVSVLGEFGIVLQQLCDPRANGPQVMLKKVLLDLYSKSGWNKVLRSSVYSDVEKNTKIVQAPNVTILGESTPETFFDGLGAEHIAEGLIPRFSIVEYTGPRVPRNKYANMPPSQDLVQKFADMATIAIHTSNNMTCCPVQVEPLAQRVLDDFDIEADTIMNRAHSDVDLQLWNRAHLKALKLSALIAVGCNPHQPVVTRDIAEWAIKFVRKDVAIMLNRFKSGDIGTGDSKQMHDLKRVIEIYYKSDFGAVAKYGVHRGMHADRVIPYLYLNKRTAGLASFKADRMDATGALRKTIQALVDSGMLVEVPKGQLMEKYKFSGLAWGVGTGWA